jgi:hypothetical protein
MDSLSGRADTDLDYVLTWDVVSDSEECGIEGSRRAENGNKGARRELREAVRSSSPEVIARASDFARKGQAILIETISAGKPLMEEAISARLDLMRTELAGESPSALELLLVERIASPTCDCARSRRC